MLSKKRLQSEIEERFATVKNEIEAVSAKISKKSKKIQIQNKGYEQKYSKLMENIASEALKSTELSDLEQNLEKIMREEDKLILIRKSEAEREANMIGQKHKKLQSTYLELSNQLNKK